MLFCCYCKNRTVSEDSCHVCYHTPSKSCACWRSVDKAQASQPPNEGQTKDSSSISERQSHFTAATGTTEKPSLSEEMERYSQAFERARSFEDDDEFFPGPLEEVQAPQFVTPDRPTANSLFTPPAGPKKWRERSQALPALAAKGEQAVPKPRPQSGVREEQKSGDKDGSIYAYDGSW